MSSPFADVVVGIDDAEFEIAMDRVMINTEILMDDVQQTDDEADRVKQKVDSLVATSDRSYQQILQGARRTAMIVRGLAVATGNAYAEIYAIGIEIALVTAELLIDVATAEATTVIGVVGAAAKVGLVIALLRKARELEQGQTEAAARTEGIITVLSALTYLTILDPRIAVAVIVLVLTLVKLL